MVEISVMEKAIPSKDYDTQRILLEKAYRGSVSPELKAVIANYVNEATGKLKRIIDTLN